MNSKIIFITTSCYILIGAILLTIFSCKNDGVLGSLIVMEPIGVERSLEYVEVKIPVDAHQLKNKAIYLRDKSDGSAVKGQILNESKVLLDSNLVRCLFPIHIRPNETNKYQVVVQENEETFTDLKAEGEWLNLFVENEFYKADLTAKRSSKNVPLAPGQITSISLKEFDGIKLERPDIKMHWSPSFKKKNEEYKTMAHLHEFDSIHIDKGPYVISVYRSGKVEGYEEIQLKGEYKFYAGQPFFRFSSEMTMIDSLTVTMLRNDEMTMNKFFTHAFTPLNNGKVKTVILYDKPPLISHYTVKELRKHPIDANANWFGFYNDSTNFGFGSIRIRFDYKNLNGVMSPMTDAQTKISYAYNEGRYWDRRFVDSGELKVPKGSRYFEDNVYSIFKVDTEDPSQEIQKLYNQLSNPVIVQYNSSI
ncbi:MAG: hypothetical protein ABJO28_19980 [Maribacter dokdonensis]|uniref:hypothetical protein n=1 Tax=Maribacter dokdonensis TaxID=320912 RepID=UPI00329844F0